MSVLVVMKVGGNTETFQKAMVDRAADLEASAERAKSSGAIHHRFGVGDGHVVVIDEWDSAEQFEQFFTDPQMQAFVAELGGDTSMPPEIWITEALSSPDQF